MKAGHVVGMPDLSYGIMEKKMETIGVLGST